MKWCATLVTAYGVPLAGDNDDPADDSAAIGLSGRGCMASCSSISLIRWYIYKNNNNTKYIHVTYSILSVCPSADTANNLPTAKVSRSDIC